VINNLLTLRENDWPSKEEVLPRSMQVRRL
jgi:hypothetical protein